MKVYVVVCEEHYESTGVECVAATREIAFAYMRSHVKSGGNPPDQEWYSSGGSLWFDGRDHTWAIEEHDVVGPSA